MVSGISSMCASAAEPAAEAALVFKPRTDLAADLPAVFLGLEEAAAVLAVLLTDLRPKTDSAFLLEALVASLCCKPSTAKASLSC